MNKQQLISHLPITSHLGRTPLVSTAVALLMLAGCATRSTQAPVEDRGNTPAPSEPTAQAAPPKPLPGIENAGKPGYYTVKSGDTLIRISLESGQNWRDLVKWNNLDNPNLIEVGQVLRVVSPAVDASTVATKPVASTKVEPRSLDNKPVPPATVASGTAPASAPAATPAAAPVAAAAPREKDGEDDIPWAWPAAGAVVAPFDDTRHKGISVGGKAGDPVLAAADGRVVYAGSGLRGYGNLVIIKHNATYLTAYAHNQTLLVKEDQSVRRGQKIAEMGSTEADRVELHFEIRRQGRPIDPVKLLPAR